MGTAPSPVSHYENFPVGSLALPNRLRRPVFDLYRFARDADDAADEGDLQAEARLSRLAAMRAELDRIELGQDACTPEFAALGRTIREHGLPIRPFRDLIDAFSQDVIRTRYDTFDELLDYCRRSADPVGRLMLHLFGETTPSSLAMGDRICTALQLINFLQDVAIDHSKGRIYLPAEDLQRFGVDEAAIAEGVVDERWQALMRFEIGRAREMLLAGAPLGRRLRGRPALELRLIVMGGARILEKLDAVRGDVFRHRPVLGPLDWLLLGFRALFRYPA